MSWKSAVRMIKCALGYHEYGSWHRTTPYELIGLVKRCAECGEAKYTWRAFKDLSKRPKIYDGKGELIDHGVKYTFWLRAPKNPNARPKRC